MLAVPLIVPEAEVSNTVLVPPLYDPPLLVQLPSTVRLLLLAFSAPIVNVTDPVRVLAPFKVTPTLLLMVRSAVKVAGNSIREVVCAVLPLYSSIALPP